MLLLLLLLLLLRLLLFDDDDDDDDDDDPRLFNLELLSFSSFWKKNDARGHQRQRVPKALTELEFRTHDLGLRLGNEGVRGTSRREDHAWTRENSNGLAICHNLNRTRFQPMNVTLGRLSMAFKSIAKHVGKENPSGWRETL